jgi:hypothetical protein
MLGLNSGVASEMERDSGCSYNVDDVEGDEM